MKGAVDHKIIEELQKQIQKLQGHDAQERNESSLGLGALESAFPGKVFPRGTVHELISLTPEAASSTNGFVSMVLGKLMHKSGCCIWVTNRKKIFPPALKTFGVEPEQILFVEAWRVKDMLWTIEEALKCEALSAVIGEVSELSFNDSRRLQLAVEKSKVTGFIHRYQPKQINAVACSTRWKINPVASTLINKMPGVGFPRWNIELLKVRGGKPGKWMVQWSPQGLEYISTPSSETKTYDKKIA